MIARGEAQSGALEAALATIDRALEQIERPGWEERCHLAEVLRIKGWILSLRGDVDGAQDCYLKSLAWACEQQAKSWELRTSTSLARLWRAQGRREEAYELLNRVYAWFTEGFDTKDLKEASGLLEQLR
jgi:predicted ATPase